MNVEKIQGPGSVRFLDGWMVLDGDGRMVCVAHTAADAEMIADLLSAFDRRTDPNQGRML